MKNIRIIPRLDIKGPNVVKPVNTEALRVVGKPQEMAQRYDQDGADELLYLDIVASLYQRSIDFDLLKSVVENIFIPVTVGGGIRSVQDIDNILRCGADKVAINTYAVHNPQFLKEAVERFGSQCIVLFVEVKHQSNGFNEVYTDGGREHTGKDALEWIKEALALGVGEILLTSIDRDGTRKGYDLDFIKQVNAVAQVPVVVHGGAGSFESLEAAVTQGHADALAISSILHYKETTIRDIKKYLAAHHINVRLD